MISRLFSSCWFGFRHDEPVRDFRRTKTGDVALPRVLVMRCQNCMADLGPVLKGQKLRLRRVKVPKRPADVLRLPRRKVS